jgi:alkanesulfonate monooxygenase SsuD/methylene tetrahydromethanopterin reductase-like flavin-dependent oxidoreductase (luciferase family)
MELGLALPTSGPQTSPETIVKVAKEAERLGYAALWTYERLLRPIDNVTLWSGVSRSRCLRSTARSTSRWKR